MKSTPPGGSGRADTGRVGRWLSTHFHDYTPAAFRMWVGIVVAGAVAGGYAVGAQIDSSAAAALQTATGVLLVAAAAWFPVEIPRSKYSLSAADAFIFTTLAVLGAPAAILAAGCDGLIGALRSTKRLSSRLSTPAAHMAAMAVCATLFAALTRLFGSFGWQIATSRLAALVLVGIVPFALTSLPLMATVTLKRGRWPDLRDWFSSLSWMAAVYLVAALAAGVVQLIAVQQGLAPSAIIGVAVLVVIVLLRTSITKNEAEHAAQDEKLTEAKREAEVNQQRFVAAFENAAIGMAIVDPSGDILRVNTALCDLLRLAAADLHGRPFLAVLHPSDVKLFERQAEEISSSQQGTAYSIELRCRATDETELWVALHCGRFSDPEGAVDGLIYQLHDITSRQVAERRLHHVAYHDSLTDLANRACFHERLSAAVETSRADPAKGFAVMFLDLDRFKVINDSLGHFAGNELLREVGRRLLKCLRPDDLVARLGGDEFAVLLVDQADTAEGILLAEHMIAELAVPLKIRGSELHPSTSIGITFSNLGHRTVDELLRDADLAMYEAKAAGRGQVAIFDRTMHERIVDKLSLEADLRHAIGEGDLSLAFQPLFGLSPHRLVGFEALARWVHPARGAVSPAVFIGIAEEAGQIEALTAWAIDSAVAQLGRWHRDHPALRDVGMNVNISGRDLAKPTFVDFVLSTLDRHQVTASHLTLEITESVLMNHLSLAQSSLARLRAGGVRVAIDDFGTGYSSLSYLSSLPIDCLKIDRSFVVAMALGPENVEIVKAVLMLGKALAKKVVAEGIETEAQLAALRTLGVDVGQGYLLGRPMSAGQAEKAFATKTEPAL